MPLRMVVIGYVRFIGIVRCRAVQVLETKDHDATKLFQGACGTDTRSRGMMQPEN